MSKLAMIAFGGNALLRAGEKGTYQEQLRNVENTCAQLRHLIERGYNIVIGHGNGPQVGNVLLQHEAGKQQFGLPAMPMDFCGAETQGSIAYLIETALEKVLRSAGIQRRVVSLVTRVEVAADDPMFLTPTKFVGPYYKEIPGQAGDDGLAVIADGDRQSFFKQDPRGLGWRKVVASPVPLRIANIDIVERLAREGDIVITVGGGGIPVVATEDGHRGVEAVIDKDLASALAAVTMKADEFYILTDVPKVFINYRKPDQQALGTLTVADAKRYLAEGQFAEGSMAPKVRAGIRFVEAGGKTCIITEATALEDPACGTRIIP